VVVMLPRATCGAFLTSALLAACGVSARAYEADFHYGLTKWLAVRAGFCDGDAETIAQGTLAPDEDSREATALVMSQVLLRTNIGASKTVQAWHFPGAGPVPGLPAARAVVAGSPLAHSKVSASGGILRAFGEGLHPLQDSWSHRGVPDTPGAGMLSNALALATNAQGDPRTLSWGHSLVRGGWANHYADLTYLDPQSATDAAHATYDELVTLVQLRPSTCSRGAPPSFASLIGDINPFILADTRAAKKSWFKQTGVPLQREDVLDKIDLKER
jgi:hypothetical protein